MLQGNQKGDSTVEASICSLRHIYQSGDESKYLWLYVIGNIIYVCVKKYFGEWRWPYILAWYITSSRSIFLFLSPNYREEIRVVILVDAWTKTIQVMLGNVFEILTQWYFVWLFFFKFIKNLYATNVYYFKIGNFTNTRFHHYWL